MNPYHTQIATEINRLYAVLEHRKLTGAGERGNQAIERQIEKLYQSL